MRKSTLLMIAGVCLILCGVSIPIAAWINSYSLSPQYTSTATIQVIANPPDDSPGSGFLVEQALILRTKGILYPVIDDLGLVDRWSGGLPGKLSREDVFDELQEMIQVSRKENTDMLLIAATSVGKQEAADLANNIAITYEKKRQDYREQKVANALEELKAEVDKQRGKAQETGAEATRIRLRNAVKDPNPESMEESNDAEAEHNFLIEDAKHSEARQRVEDLKDQLLLAVKMSADDLTLNELTINDPTISEILPKYQAARSEENKLLTASPGLNHPPVKSLEADIAAMKKQLDDVLDAMRKNLQTRLYTAQANLENEQKNYDAIKPRVEGVGLAEYTTAKLNYLKEKGLLAMAGQLYDLDKQKLQNLPESVKILERAEPATTLSGAYILHTLSIATVRGLFCAICGVALLIIARSVKRRALPA